MKPARITVTAAVIATGAALAACGGQPAGSAPAAGPASAPTPAATAPAVTAPAATAPAATAPAGPQPPQASRVVLSRVSYPWRWPNYATAGGQVTHEYPVPPVPELVRISIAHHHAAGNERAYDRMSFTFTNAFPSYHFAFTDSLVSDPSGALISLNASDVLKVVFSQAQAHTANGSGSTIGSQPARVTGCPRMTDYAQAGDFEGTLTYGIGITRPVPRSNPQFPVRAYEVAEVTASGQHLYVVAIDVDATMPA
jgi:hypothetical protein